MGKAPAVCGYPGCPELTPLALCPAHRTMRNRDDQQRYRNPAKQKVYHSRRWTMTRRRQLGAHPWCQAPDCTNAALEVDHIKGFTGPRDPQAWDPNNLQSLCKKHHSEKTIREVYGRT